MAAWNHIVDAVTQEFADLGDVATVARVAVRLCLAAIVGAALGMERESRGKPAGLRTHMLVSLGAALIVIGPLLGGADESAMSRVVQGVVAGIGFLGAGAIVKGKNGHDPQNLTTAASLWLVAALGMTVGLGHAGAALLATALALVILRVLPSDFPGSGPCADDRDSPPPRSGDGDA